VSWAFMLPLEGTKKAIPDGVLLFPRPCHQPMVALASHHAVKGNPLCVKLALSLPHRAQYIVHLWEALAVSIQLSGANSWVRHSP
jgi:hypothetical protein